MRESLQRVEFLGGLWHGSWVSVGRDVVSLSLRDGAVLWIYERGELVEGPKVREVFRHTATVPMAGRC